MRVIEERVIEEKNLKMGFLKFTMVTMSMSFVMSLIESLVVYEKFKFVRN